MAPDEPWTPPRDQAPETAPEIPEPVRLSTPLLSLTGPPAQREPERRSVPRWLRVALVVAVVLVVGLSAVALRVAAGGASGVEVSDRTADPSRGADTDGATDPLDAGYGMVDVGCTGDYLVVLASTRRTTSDAEFVQDPLQRFGSAQEPGRYLTVSGSCSALRGSANKSGSAYLPYLGPFGTPVAACEARMDHTDTSTYVVRLDSDVGGSTNCACSYAAADLPPLDPATDARATGDDRFWVVELQAMLTRAGYVVPKPHVPRYGPATTAAVRQLQSASGLDVTGAMDGASWAALKRGAC